MAKFRFCGTDSQPGETVAPTAQAQIGEAIELPELPPAEEPVTLTDPADDSFTKAFPGVAQLANQLGVDRTGISHLLKINGFNFSEFLLDATYVEEKSKDKTLNITLDNTGFSLTDFKMLTEGYLVEWSVFDGQDWANFGRFVIVEPVRKYDQSGKITLRCLSTKVKMMLKDESRNFENMTDSEIVQLLAEEFDFVADIADTKTRRANVVMANEPVSLFLNRLAQRNGYDFRIKPPNEMGELRDTLYFRPPEASTDAPIKLVYRPANGLGSIFSATVKVKGASKKGRRAKPKVRATDFTRGTVDNEVLDAIKNGQLGVAQIASVPTTLQEPELIKSSDVLQTLLQGDQDFDSVIDPDNILDNTPIEFVFPSLTTTNSLAEAKKLLTNLKRTNKYKFEIDIATFGTHDLRVDRLLEVEGLGFQDDGRWVVTKAEHSYKPGEYRAKLHAKAWVKPRPPRAPQAAAGEKHKINIPTEQGWGLIADAAGNFDFHVVPLQR